MALIEQAILAIDVAIDRGNTYRKSVERMYIYRLTSIDAEPLVRTLEEIGNLDFNTRLEVDKQNNTIIAYASLADHVTIRTLIEKLDGSVRQFAVIQLRRLEADYVAGTTPVHDGGQGGETAGAATVQLLRLRLRPAGRQRKEEGRIQRRRRCGKQPPLVAGQRETNCGRWRTCW